MNQQIQPAVILPAATYEAIVNDLKQVSEAVQLQSLVLQHLGGLRTKEAMKLTGIKSITGLKGAVKKGELVETYKGRYPEYSIMSIIAYLQKKGFTTDHIRLQVAS